MPTLHDAKPSNGKRRDAALTPAAVRSAKPETTQYKLFDKGSGGLYLLVKPNGKKTWRVRYSEDDREKIKTLGDWPDLSLEQAQEVAKGLRKGIVASFETAARDWIRENAPKWKPVTERVVTARLETYAFPKIGDKPVAAIKPSEVLEIVEARRAAGQYETATRLLQYLVGIFGLACVRYDLTFNPAAEVGRTRLARPKSRHRLMGSMEDLGTALAQFDSYQNRTTARAIEFLVLTAARSAEVRFADWSELRYLDRPGGAEWHLDASRMKMGQPHVVPLSPEAVEILALQACGSWPERGLVFGQGSKAMSENTMLYALYKKGWRGKMTIHGFRSNFSSLANEHGWSPDVIETALAHQLPGGKVRRAYARATYTKDRRKLMEWWAKQVMSRKRVASLLS
ncbi:MAG: tyrosine-type recombinase/integrase [Hyphomonas sp.]